MSESKQEDAPSQSEILDEDAPLPDPSQEPAADARRVQQVFYHVVYEPDANGKTHSECFLEVPKTGVKITVPYYKLWFVTITGEEMEIERIIKPFKEMVKKITELKNRFVAYTKQRTDEMKAQGELPNEESKADQSSNASGSEESSANAEQQGQKEEQKGN